MTGTEVVLLHELISRSAVEAPERPAVIDEAGHAVTFEVFDRQVQSIAAWLEQRTERGDRVAVLADSSAAYALLYYAAPRSGRILTFVNQRLNPSDQMKILRAAEPSLIVGDDRYLRALEAESGAGSPRFATVTFESDQWAEATGGDARPTAPVGPDDPAWLIFTSGSTGTPKGVLHTHRSVLTAVRGGVVGRSISAPAVYLLPFPMCHVTGVNMVMHHARSCTVVLVSHFRPESFVEMVNTHSVTSCSLAPTMIQSLVAHLAATDASMPTLHTIAYGSAAITVELLHRAASVLPVRFSQGYGMTETAGHISFLTAEDHVRGLESEPGILLTAGRPHPYVSVRILDRAGAEVPAGSTGEIAVRGDQVMSGYWRDPEATEAVMVDGWLLTGDIGRLDEAGRVAVVDRSKDIIISGGENVASREVEEVIATHPAVDTVAVVGVPDDYWGEAVCAVVVRRGDLSTDEVVDHVRGRISSWKRPRHVLFVTALPTTTNGKVDKQQVRAQARREIAASGY